MLRSLFSAVSGLRGHQVMMDTIGNNIANVNTAGYKSSSTVFEDTLSQVVKSAGAPQGASGGTNPAQVGLGMRLGGITTNFSQGATQLTGRQTDIAIQGDGFFVVKQDGQTMFSRAGAFNFDASGNVVNPDGAIVQGWMADNNGVISVNGPTGGLKLPIGQSIKPVATSTLSVGGNLPSDAPLAPAAATPPAPAVAGSILVNSMNIYDAQGKAVPATFTYTHTAADKWSLDVTVPKADGTGPVSVATQAIDWNGTKFTPATTTMGAAGLTSAGYTFTAPVTVSLGTATQPLTQYAAANTVQPLEQDGSATGTLQSFTLAPDGTLLGSFSNGLKQALGRVAMANFNNPPGLEKAGGSLYSATANSGTATVGTAGSGGRGSLASGALEMSNVDLAQEFTNLVVAQRGFQANSKVVTASDEILQDLLSMKR
jgi:flagellar hook protein FlgE